jgi:hypothetical protein
MGSIIHTLVRHGGGSIDIEGGVAGNNRKDMSSTKKAEEEGRG